MSQLGSFWACSVPLQATGNITLALHPNEPEKPLSSAKVPVMPCSFCLLFVHSLLLSVNGLQCLPQTPPPTPQMQMLFLETWSFHVCVRRCDLIILIVEQLLPQSTANGSSMQACQPAIAFCMTGFTETVSASPQSDHSIWAASSSDSGLASLAVRLRTLPGSAAYSQDGMCCTNIRGFAVVGLNARAVCHVDMISLFASVIGKHVFLCLHITWAA